MPLRYLPVTPGRWEALAEFFGSSGAYAGCWCTWWRLRAGEFEAGCRAGAAGNRRRMERLTVEGHVPGLLAYEAPGSPIGWVSVGPRPEFGRVLRSPTLRPDPDDAVTGDPADASVWSVVCFWLPRGHRGAGVASGLLDAAVRHATTGGARVVEGYPVDTTGQRRPAADLYTGTLGMFTRAGFAVAARRGKRLVVRRPVVGRAPT